MYSKQQMNMGLRDACSNFQMICLFLLRKIDQGESIMDLMYWSRKFLVGKHAFDQENALELLKTQEAYRNTCGIQQDILDPVPPRSAKNQKEGLI